jgi:hypothetical protein
MVWCFIRPLARVINIFCVILVAGTYVFTYYDYLHTVTHDGLVEVSSLEETELYSNGKLGVVVVHQEVTVSPGSVIAAGN